MSQFLGGTAGQDGAIVFRNDDTRLWGERHIDEAFVWYLDRKAWNSDFYRSTHWPGRSGLDASGDEWHAAVWYDMPHFNSGAIAKLGFSGYTRDVNGVAIGGCTVRLFRTSDGLLTCQVVSDANGFFTLDTQFYPDTHFYTAHKGDVPEIAGASPSTLVAG